MTVLTFYLIVVQFTIDAEGRRNKGGKMKRKFISFFVAFLMVWFTGNAFAQSSDDSNPYYHQDNQETARLKPNTINSLPDIVLVPRLFTGNGTSPATDKMTLPNGSHVTVAVVVYAAVDTKVNLTRYCKSEVKKTKKDGTTTTSSESISTDVKVVGKTSVLLSWRQLEPSANGMCTLTVEVGDKKEIFTVYGEK